MPSSMLAGMPVVTGASDLLLICWQDWGLCTTETEPTE